jgi:hypothetical protein
VLENVRTEEFAMALLVFFTFVAYGVVGATTTGSLKPDDGPYLGYFVRT